VTWREAGGILGVSMRRIGALVANGELTRGPRWQHRQLSRSEVEQLGTTSLEPSHRWRGLLLAGHAGSGGVAGREPGAGAAARRRWAVACRADPHGHAFRREQLLTVANARRARFHAYDLGA
jgi:hypothetical protein